MSIGPVWPTCNPGLWMWTSRAAETRSLLTDALAQATTMDKLLRVVQRLLVRLTASCDIWFLCLLDLTAPLPYSITSPSTSHREPTVPSSPLVVPTRVRNPFELCDFSRSRAVAKYKQLLDESPELTSQLITLSGHRLLRHCTRTQ